jgi:hypothetical protein
MGAMRVKRLDFDDIPARQAPGANLRSKSALQNGWSES